MTRSAGRVPRRTGWAIGILLVVLILYGAWTELTRTRGAQTVAFVPSRQACDAIGQLRYCVYRAADGTSGDIVYYLHGRNLDERSWNDDTYFTAMLRAEWQRTGVRPPTVVAVSYGPVWLLTPKGARPDSGLLDEITVGFARIERAIGRPRRRMLLGESMGGLNVLVAGLSRPRLFAKVAALCPGVYTVSPFAPLSTIRATMAATGASPKIVFGIWMMARKYLANDVEWQRISPLKLAERAGPSYPALYLSNGLYDPYGNFAGSQRLAALTTRRGQSTEWHPLYGGHCAIDVGSLAVFLAR